MGSSSSKTAYSANNTRGASVAAYELSSALTDTLNEINLNGHLQNWLGKGTLTDLTIR